MVVVNLSISSNKSLSIRKRISAVIASASIVFIVKDLLNKFKDNFINDLFACLSLEGMHLDNSEDLFMSTFKQEFPDNSGR